MLFAFFLHEHNSQEGGCEFFAISLTSSKPSKPKRSVVGSWYDRPHKKPNLSSCEVAPNTFFCVPHNQLTLLLSHHGPQSVKKCNLGKTNQCCLLFLPNRAKYGRIVTQSFFPQKTLVLSVELII